MKIYLPALRRGAAAAAIAVVLGSAPAALAHHVSGSKSAVAGLPDGTSAAVQGRLAILDFVRGTGRERIYAIVAGDGTATRIAIGDSAGALRQGMRLAVIGHASRGALAVDSQSVLGGRAIAAAAAATTVEGMVQLLHADYFEGGESRFIWTVQQDNGDRRELDFAIVPAELKSGMRVSVTGEPNATGLVPHSIQVLADPPVRDVAPATDVTAAASTASTLVILLNFPPTPAQPFTQAAVQDVVFTGASSIANFWTETSFGKQLMTGTVTPWLTASFAAPTTCNYMAIATEAKRVAQLAGYNLASYQKFVYLFTKVNACGWAGLGEVPGSQTWSNQYNTLGVIGHEIGHNWGLGHANSLPCNGVTIATNCPTNRPEYGDPWDIMGNVSSRHANAWQKNDAGWVADTAVATHRSGTATYTLSPLELPGGALYAVQIPAAYHRTYWLEYRTATGFDAGLPTAATNGTIIHLGGLMHQSDHSEYGCWDTCFLDMVPSTSTMSDGGLTLGNAFVDQMTGVTVTAVAKGAGGLTVSVASPPMNADIGVYRRNSPSTGLPVNKFLLDYGFDHAPDAKIVMGGVAGDIPVVGSVGADGLSSLIIYRNGIWNIDTNRDGIVDKAVGHGGVPGDIPIVGDVNGDGFGDLVIYRNGTWFADQYLNGTVDKIFYFGGVPGDIPLLADMDGDGIDDLVVYRHGTWFVSTKRTGTADLIYYHGGLPQDLPALFDADGDGKLDLCIFRDGIWFVSTKRNGIADVIFEYGGTGDIPLVGKFY